MVRQIVILCMAFSLLTVPVFAFSQEGGMGCGAGKCSDCHSLSLKEATTLLKGIDKVLAVEFSELPGFWTVDAEKAGQKFPIFVDFSKKYVLAGSIIKIATGEDLTQQRMAQLNKGNPAAAPSSAVAKKVDIKSIPVDDAILLGRADAKSKVIVFTDPECPYCKKVHSEMQEVVKADPNIAFLIKLMPLKMHPNAYGLSKTILCSTNPLSVLEAVFHGAPVAPSACPTTKVDETLASAQQLGITSTPTLILPDGTILPGYKKAPDLLKILGSNVTLPAAGK
ncbi:MAG: protein-disulfide isomerase [Deltaproteobacteria bacterium HGW-Deltaproteobacteria-4]|nr:MAG: protein-disulfide isomerase [Deltaproteobacteria bacterium HGW-Deltaproteobacteria-4]